MSKTNLWLVTVLGLVCSTLPSSARAQDATAKDKTAQQDADARAHFRLARAHYENGDFVKAAEEFQKAYEISGRSQLLYNLYVAHRDANAPAKAADALRTYLDTAEDIPNRRQIEARLAALERGLGDPEDGEQPSAQSPTEPEPAGEDRSEGEQTRPPPSQDGADGKVPEGGAGSALEPSSQPGQLDDSAGSSKIMPIALMAGGGALVAGAVVTGLLASSAQSDLEDGCPDRVACRADLKSTRNRGQTLAVVTDVLWISGALVAGAGLAWFVFGSGDAEHARADAPARASVGCSPSGCGGTVAVTF